MTSFPIQGPVAGQGGTGGGHVIEDEGTPVAQRANLNFIGAGVTVTDNDPDTDVTIPGGASVIGTQQFGIGSHGIYPGISNPANAIQQREQGTFNQQVKYIAFPDGVDTLAYLDWFTPQNWDAGTVNLKLYWTTQLPSVVAETIEIEASAVARGDSDAIGAVDFGTPVSLTDTLLALDDTHLTAQSGALTIAGTPAKFDWIQFKFLRDISADNLQGEVQLLGLVLQYTIDSATSVG